MESSLTIDVQLQTSSKGIVEDVKGRTQVTANNDTPINSQLQNSGFDHGCTYELPTYGAAAVQRQNRQSILSLHCCFSQRRQGKSEPARWRIFREAVMSGKHHRPFGISISVNENRNQGITHSSARNKFIVQLEEIKPCHFKLTRSKGRASSLFGTA